MINSTEMLTILKVNGLNKDSSLQDVKNFLNQVNYSREDKLRVIEILMTQGWTLKDNGKPFTASDSDISTPASISTTPASIPPTPAPMPSTPVSTPSTPAFTSMPTSFPLQAVPDQGQKIVEPQLEIEPTFTPLPATSSMPKPSDHINIPKTDLEFKPSSINPITSPWESVSSLSLSPITQRRTTEKEVPQLKPTMQHMPTAQEISDAAKAAASTQDTSSASSISSNLESGYPEPTIVEETMKPASVFTPNVTPNIPPKIEITQKDDFTVTMPSKKKSSKKILILLIILIIVLLLGAGSVYAYLEKIWPFSFSSYTEENFSSSLLAKISQIESASYAFSGAINVVQRDQGATPFVLKVSNEKELKQKYYYDSERLRNIGRIISKLNSDAGYSYIGTISYNPAGSTVKSVVKIYPETIEKIFTTEAYSNYSIVDPETKSNYTFQVIENGRNFNLTVEFATDAAIKAIKEYGYVASSTIIDGRKVVFTKDSQTYLNLDTEPPKPLIVQMSDTLRTLPADMNAKLVISAASEFKPQALSNWSFNIDAEGDFGDLAFKINADLLKKDDNYYFKINNIPSFFLFDQLAMFKGKWVVVPSKAASSSEEATSTNEVASNVYINDDYSSLSSSIQEGVSGSEEKYKENRDKFIRFIKKVVAIADEEKIFLFKNKPSPERVDGRQLVKYELGLRKEKILSFYTRVQTELSNDPELSDYAKMIDQGYIDYLKSEEFSQVFDYVDKNNTLTLWVDSQGFPVILQNITRVIPPNEAIQLTDKQINQTFKLDISNINKPLDIPTPTDATSLDKITNDMKNNPSQLNLKGQAAMVSSGLSNMRAQAELVFDKNSSYGQKPFALGPCSKATSTLFGDEQFAKLLDNVTKSDPKLATCVSTGSVGKVVSWAVSAPLPGDEGFSWCVDSKGSSKRIIESLAGNLCGL